MTEEKMQNEVSGQRNVIIAGLSAGLLGTIGWHFVPNQPAMGLGVGIVAGIAPWVQAMWKKGEKSEAAALAFGGVVAAGAMPYVASILL